MTKQLDMFATSFEDLPLFSGTAARVETSDFVAQPVDRQEAMPGFERDWAETAKVLKAQAQRIAKRYAK